MFGTIQVLAVLSDLASYSLSMQHVTFCPITSTQRAHVCETADAILKPYLSWALTSNTRLLMQEDTHRAMLHCVS